MSKIRAAVIHVIVISLVAVLANTIPAHAIEQTSQKAVLVTGASTGIGRKVTEKLSAEGYFVYAGARKDKDIQDLNRIENVQAVRLDVTIQEDIDAAVKVVEAGGFGLHGIVNNAGVIVIGPLIETDESELDFVFDVNIYGPYRITKAFAPMIIESQGRVINISSISGTLSGAMAGVYSMSKHALEAYTDSLAAEMHTFDVKVSAVVPGNYKTNIFHNRCDRMLATGYDPKNSYWQDFADRVVETCKNRPVLTDPEPDQVADAVLHALFADDPKQHYLVVPEQRQAEWTIQKAIEELVSLNRDHSFSYSRDELIKMLDAEIGLQSQ